jgi:hypothetical protein
MNTLCSSRELEKRLPFAATWARHPPQLFLICGSVLLFSDFCQVRPCSLGLCVLLLFHGLGVGFPRWIDALVRMAKPSATYAVGSCFRLKPFGAATIADEVERSLLAWHDSPETKRWALFHGECYLRNAFEPAMQTPFKRDVRKHGAARLSAAYVPYALSSGSGSSLTIAAFLVSGNKWR